MSPSPLALAPSRRLRRALLVALAVVGVVALAGAALGPELVRRYFFEHIRPAPMAPLPRVPELGTLRGATCGVCHNEIHAEWQASLHGRAMTDPFFVAEYEAQDRIFACLRCHAPLHEQQPTIVTGFAQLGPPRPEERPNPAHDRELQHEGVTCVVCHQYGDTLVGPLPLRPNEVPHRTMVDPNFGANERCVRCHSAEGFPGSDLRREALPTFVEHREYRARGGTQRCVECHFPAVERPLTRTTPPRRGRSHRLLGSRDAGFIRQHLDVRAPACRVTGSRMTCSLALTNRAGHRMPTGEPGRDLAVVLRPADGSRAGEHHILRRMDRVDLVERAGEDNTMHPAETRAVTVTSAQGAATLAVEFCLYEARDPLLALTRTPYRSVCRTLAAWDVGADGRVGARRDE